MRKSSPSGPSSLLTVAAILFAGCTGHGKPIDRPAEAPAAEVQRLAPGEPLRVDLLAVTRREDSFVVLGPIGAVARAEIHQSPEGTLSVSSMRRDPDGALVDIIDPTARTAARVVLPTVFNAGSTDNALAIGGWILGPAGVVYGKTASGPTGFEIVAQPTTGPLAGTVVAHAAVADQWVPCQPDPAGMSCGPQTTLAWVDPTGVPLGRRFDGPPFQPTVANGPWQHISIVDLGPSDPASNDAKTISLPSGRPVSVTNAFRAYADAIGGKGSASMRLSSARFAGGECALAEFFVEMVFQADLICIANDGQVRTVFLPRLTTNSFGGDTELVTDNASYRLARGEPTSTLTKFSFFAD